MGLYVDNFVHDLFPDIRSFQSFAFRERPVLKLLQQAKHEGVGKSWAYPCLVQGSIAQGTTRAAVQAQQAVGGNADLDVEEFTLGYFKPGYKGGFLLDDFELAVTEGDGGVPSGAYLHSLSLKVQGAAEEFGQRQELYFIGRSGRSLALSTTNQDADSSDTDIDGGVFKCADRFQITNLRKDQLIQFAIVDGSDSGHALIDTEPFQITGLDFDNGSFTFIAAGSTSLAALDTAIGPNQAFVFNNSDFQGNSATKLPPGYQEWVTSGTPSGTFQGVNRGQDSRLGGFRIAVTPGMQLDGVIKKGLREARGLYGASGTYQVLVGSERWSQLMELGEARGYRMLNGQSVLGGYKALEYCHGSMRAEVIDVPSMSSNDMFFAKMDKWTVRHLKGWPRPMGHDGLKSLRKADDDSYEYRTASYYHYGCEGINHQGRADISTIAL